ncbi:MAG: AI-2E family transporter [Hyphomicrobiales bacterium]|nr:AI-2E family transporter [Hyphomicrobiales bacterium]
MTLERQLRFWLAAAALFVGFLWLFSGVLLPFVAGIALAYLLDPVADRLEGWGLPRAVAALAIILGLVVLLLLIMILVAPLLGDQFVRFVDELPTLVDRLRELVAPWVDGPLGRLLGEKASTLDANLGQAIGQAAGWIGQLLQPLLSSGRTVLSILSVVVIAPVVAAYMLIDWDRMVARIDEWLPRRHRAVIRRLAGEMDTAVSGFVRGQVAVSVTMGLYYGLGLAMVGLRFGLLIGLMAGLLGVIPYLGFGSGLVVGMIVAVVQYWPDWHGIALVAAIFAVGQGIEGWVLTPNWVGRSVGLHPVWLLFSLFAFGSLFGFVGMLVAVPTAASIGVLARYALEQYLASPLHHEVEPGDGSADV